MIMTKLILLLTFLIVIHLHNSGDALDVATELVLAYQWPPAVCTKPENPCPDELRRKEDGFTLLGEWPTFHEWRRIDPRYCTGSRFNEHGEIDGLNIDQMNRRWPSLDRNTSNWEFWEHEWYTHGICGRFNDKQKIYFEAALILFESYNPYYYIVEQGGIAVGEEADLSEFSAKLTIEGKSPVILCELRDGIYHITRVFWCFNRYATELKDCPEKYGKSCGPANTKARLLRAPVL